MPAAAPALHHDLHRAGYYPELVVDVLDVALADEEVVAHLVHPETTFDAAEVRRHVTVLVLTPTRLIVAHVDDHPADSEHPSASASATTEAVPIAELTSVALTQGLAPRRLQETVRRGGLGIPEALARAVRARMDDDRRLRGRELGRRAACTDRRLLRWLLTAYARPGSGLTQSSIAARLGITQGAVSHLLAGRKGPPLPSRLLRACRARARALRYGAGRSRDVG